MAISPPSGTNRASGGLSAKVSADKELRKLSPSFVALFWQVHLQNPINRVHCRL
jgi:hypothetical protein